MLRDIVTMPNPILRQVAHPVTCFAAPLHALVEAMLATMRHAGGVGLAAPQIGIDRRLFVMQVTASDERLAPDHPLAGRALVLVNPVIVEASATLEEAREGCLSIPGYGGWVPRHERVVVQAQDPWGEPHRYEVAAFLARVMQHEIDHLDGTLFVDRLTSADKLFQLEPPTTAPTSALST